MRLKHGLSGWWHVIVLGALAWQVTASGGRAQGVDELFHATCKISNPSSTATGFLVHPTATKVEPAESAILITAAHVFDQASGDAATLITRRAGPDDTPQRFDVPLAIRAQAKPLWTRHPSADVAVMRVSLPAECLCRPIPLAWILGEEQGVSERFQSGASVRILTYPSQLESSDAGFAVLRSGVVASHPLRPVKRFSTFMVDASAFAGDSGGPVFLPGGVDGQGEPCSPLVVGLVSGQHRQTEKIRTAYEERTIHHPLGLSIIVHGALLRETVGQLK